MFIMKLSFRVVIGIACLMALCSCATLRIDPSNRAEQVSVTFDKTLK